MRGSLAFVLFLSATATGAQTGERAASAPAWFAIPGTASFQTGDTWTAGSTTYRLYGVQSCLRGTSFTNARGFRRDCGEASLAMLAALVRDLQPRCVSVAEVPATRTMLVSCVADRQEGRGAGSRIDLGTALISTGFGFAALSPTGTPVHPPYQVAQDVAQRSRAGLWAFRDLPEPNAIIRRALAASAPASPSSPVTARTP